MRMAQRVDIAHIAANDLAVDFAQRRDVGILTRERAHPIAARDQRAHHMAIRGNHLRRSRRKSLRAIERSLALCGRGDGLGRAIRRPRPLRRARKSPRSRSSRASPVCTQSPARNRFGIGVCVVGRSRKVSGAGAIVACFSLITSARSSFAFDAAGIIVLRSFHDDVEQLVVGTIDQFARAADHKAQISGMTLAVHLEDAPLVEQPLRGGADESHECRVGDLAIEPRMHADDRRALQFRNRREERIGAQRARQHPRHLMRRDRADDVRGAQSGAVAHPDPHRASVLNVDGFDLRARRDHAAAALDDLPRRWCNRDRSVQRANRRMRNRSAWKKIRASKLRRAERRKKLPVRHSASRSRADTRTPAARARPAPAYPSIARPSFAAAPTGSRRCIASSLRPPVSTRRRSPMVRCR